MKYEKNFKDHLITVKNLRFQIKPSYNPTILWLEKLRPRAGDYEILAQLTVDYDIIEAFEHILTLLKKELKP